MPDKVLSATGKALSTYTYAKVKSGELTAEDFRIAPETLEMQAQVAESVDRDDAGPQHAPGGRADRSTGRRSCLRCTTPCVPYRSTKAELYGIADELESKYQCRVNAAFIREAADVYEKRGRLKVE